MFIAEREDVVRAGEDADYYLTGSFDGHLDKANRVWDEFKELDLDEALAWARERADQVVIRIGYEAPYTIGFDELAPGDRPWPAEGVPAPGRRRVPSEAWKDRTDADPDAPWKATVALGPPEPPGDRHEHAARPPEWDAVAASVAEAIGATWSADDFDAHQADMRAASAKARRSGASEVGWSTMGARAYELTLTVGAPTAARAEAAARERVPPLPEGWQVHVRVDFAGD